MFKNIIAFRASEDLKLDDLNKQLKKRIFSPIGSHDAISIGFVPYSDDMDLVHSASGVKVGALRIDKKSIPGSAVKQIVKERAVALESQQGFPPGRKQMRSIKEDVLATLLPKVIPTTKIIRFMLWSDLLAIESSSGASADVVLGEMAKCLDPFPFSPILLQMSPSSCMTSWLLQDEISELFTIDDEAEMKSADDRKSSVRWKNQPIDSEEATEHHKSGKQVIKMAMTWRDKISFTLNEKFVFGRVRQTDILTARTEDEVDVGDADATIALEGGELHGLITDLIEVLGGEFKND